MRILIIKTTSLGDVVHNLPIVADIKKYYPNALIDWVVEDIFVDILSMHSGINRIIPVAIRRWRKCLLSKQTWIELLQFKYIIQSQKYDYVIDTQGLLKSGLITYLSKSLNKCGYEKSSARESISSIFYNHNYKVPRNIHAVMRNRKLAALALNYTIDNSGLNYGINIPENHFKSDLIKELPSSFILALHGTSRDSKLWVTDQWITLGKKLQLQGISLVLPWGNEDEKKRAKEIASQVAQALVLPKVGILSLANIIQRSLAVVGVDTGLAHLAVALNKPVIGIYTDTNPILNGLYGENKKKFKNLGDEYRKVTVQDVLNQLSDFAQK